MFSCHRSRWAGAALFLRAVVVLYLCAAVVMYLCAAVVLYLCAAVVWYLCAAVVLYLCAAVVLYLCAAVVLYLLFSCEAVLHLCHHPSGWEAPCCGSELGPRAWTYPGSLRPLKWRLALRGGGKRGLQEHVGMVCTF